jgi:hypothetical protein
MSKAIAGLTNDDSDAAIVYRDGLGDRFLAVDHETNDAVERLRVSADLAAQERALRERVERLLNFRHVRFPRLHPLQAVTAGTSNVVWVVADHVEGLRLSELIDLVDRHPTLVVDVNAALQVAREVLPALAVLHDSRGVTHGAVGLERLVLTPQARVMITDYALGAALGKLQFPRTRLWREFRIAMPPSAGIPRFDTRADVAGVALALLALINGRRLAAGDFPNRVRAVLDAVMERLPNGTVRPLSSSLRGWFERSLPVESRRPFGTALEAQLALDEVLKKERAYAPSQSALKSFLQRYHASHQAGKDAQDATAKARPAKGTVIDFSPPSQPATGRTGTEKSRTSTRGARRRLTPEEEEAEEIRALEAELARIAQHEAAAASNAAPDDQPAPPAIRDAAPVVEPSATAAAESAASAVSPAESSLTMAPSDESPATAALVVEPSATAAPDAVPPMPVAFQIEAEGATATESTAAVVEDASGAALLDPEPPADVPGPSAPAGEVASRQAPEADVVEIEILSLGAALPELDVAALADDTTTMVVSRQSPVSPGDPFGAVSEAAAVDEEIRELERLLDDLQDAEQSLGVAPTDRVDQPASAPSKGGPTEPAWMLVPPGPGDGPPALEEGEGASAAAADEWTLPLDFEVPPYLRSLTAAGALADDLRAAQTAVPADAIARVQMFAASAPSLPHEATPPVRRTRRRRAREGVAHVRALPARTSAAPERLAARPPTAREAVARSVRAASTATVLRFVPAGAVPRPREPNLALPAEATPVAAGLMVLPAVVALTTLNTPEVVSAEATSPLTPEAIDATLPAREDVAPAVLDEATPESGAAPEDLRADGVLTEAPLVEGAPASQVIDAVASVREDVAPAVLDEATSEPSATPEDLRADGVLAEAALVEGAPASQAIDATLLVREDVAPAVLDEATPESGAASEDLRADGVLAEAALVEGTPAIEAIAPVREDDAPAVLDEVTPESGAAPEDLRADGVLAEAALVEGTPAIDAVAPVREDVAPAVLDEATSEPSATPALGEDGALDEPALLAVVPAPEASLVATEDERMVPGAQSVAGDVATAPAASLVDDELERLLASLSPELAGQQGADAWSLDRLGLGDDQTPATPVSHGDAGRLGESRIQAPQVAAAPSAPSELNRVDPRTDAPSSAGPSFSSSDRADLASELESELASLEGRPRGLDVSIAAPIDDHLGRDRERLAAVGRPEAVIPTSQELTPAPAVDESQRATAAPVEPIGERAVAERASAPPSPVKSGKRKARHKGAGKRGASGPSRVLPPPESAVLVPADAPASAPAAPPLVAPRPALSPVASPPAVAPAGAEAAPEKVVGFAPAETSRHESARVVPRLDGTSAVAEASGSFSAPLAEAPIPFEPWRVGRPPATAGSAPARPVPPPPVDPWNVEAEAAKVSGLAPSASRSAETAESHSAAEEPAARPAPRPFDVKSSESRRPSKLPADRPSITQTADVPLNVAEVPRRRGWRVNWRRTAAASLVLMLLEGVAFATMYWFVKPDEMGTLAVQTSQAGVQVLIDGRVSGVTPLSVQLKPGRYTLEMRAGGTTKVVPVEISPGVQTTQMVQWPRTSRVGRVNVTTTPSGARILLDGTYRGTSPLTLEDVAVGPHVIVAESPSGTVKQQVRVDEDDTADVDIGIFSGWLTVFAPIEVRVFDEGAFLGTSLDGKVLISAGPHEIELVNKTLGFRTTRSVEIEPGRNTVLSIEAPNGSIVIEAPDGTEVSVDGHPAGVMPLERVSAPIGTREVVLRHPAIGQRRVMVTVGASVPARVSLLAPQ